MALNYQFGTKIQKAIRNLCLGRVLLQDNLAVGEDVVPVRGEYADGTCALPGGMFFHNNTTSAIIVQPAASNTPGAIEHSEAVTIDATTSFNASSMDGNITLTADVAKAYTVARGAYIRPASLPTVCSNLKFIQNDFIPAVMTGYAVPDDEFPGVLVTCRGLTGESFSSQQLKFAYRYRIYYADLLVDDADNTTVLFDAAEQLRDVLLEDNYLGGTCVCSDFVRMVPWHSTEWGSRGIRFRTANNIEIGWVEIDFDVWRPELWEKAPSVT